MTERIRRKAYPGQMIVGVLIAGLGVAYLGLHLLLAEWVRFRWLIAEVAAIGAIPIGAVVIYKAFGLECVACEKQLHEKSVALGEEKVEELREAVDDGDVDRIADLITNRDRGLEPTEPGLVLWYCGACRDLARIRPTGNEATELVGAAARTIIHSTTSKEESSSST